MSLPLNIVLDPAVNPERYDEDGPRAFARKKLEYLWGLPLGSLETYLETVAAEPSFIEILESPTLIPIVDRAPMVKLRCASYDYYPADVNKLYDGQETFRYIVVHWNTTAPVAPYPIESTVPPHLTLGSSYHKFVSLAAGDIVGHLEMVLRGTALRRPGSSSKDYLPDPDPRRFQPRNDSDSSDDSTDRSTTPTPSEMLRLTPPRRLLPEELEWDINDEA
uniref:Uncharacterized protein n=1 Tax=Mycena chlorophos TaxID=658473 RepID=A0ABQ0KXG7_MYCCL|nr:predicted protein [Mycena chlorophos]